MGNVSRTQKSASMLEHLTNITTSRFNSNNAVLIGQSIQLLHPDQIIVLKQVRTKLDPDSIKELAETIKTHHQQQPIVVRNAPGQRDKFILEKGERRLEACRLLGINVAAVVSGAQHDDMKVHASQLIENIQREELTAFEIAYALNRFVTEKEMSHRKIAKEVGKSHQYVTLHLSLVKATEAIRDLSNEGIVSDAETLNSLRKLVDLEPESEAIFIAKIREQEGITRDKSRRWVAWAKEAIELGQAPSEYIEAKEDEIANPPQEIEKQEPTKLEGGSLTSETTTQPITPESAIQATERPGRNVGEGSMLDSHDGPFAGDDEGIGYEDEDEETSKTVIKETTTTTTSETTTAAASGSDQSTDQAKSVDETEKNKEEFQSEMFPENQEQAVSNSIGSNERSEPISRDGYSEYLAGQLEVKISLEGKEGILLLNRLDDDPDTVWVIIEGEPQPQRVNVNEQNLTISYMQPAGKS